MLGGYGSFPEVGTAASVRHVSPVLGIPADRAAVRQSMPSIRAVQTMLNTDQQ